VADNQYDSISAAFDGMDMYNLPMPVVPPLDLNLAKAAFCQRYVADRQSPSAGAVVGFNRLDKPFIRSMGFFSNLADGLVDAESQHVDGNGGFTFRISLDRFFVSRGVISNTAGSDIVTGNATADFLNTIAVGQFIVWNDDAFVTRFGQVASIQSDTALTLTAITESTGMFANNTDSNSFRTIVLLDPTTFDLQVPTMNTLFDRQTQISDMSKIRPITGLSSFPGATPIGGGSTAIMTGVGTKYTRDVVAGQCIRFGSGANERTLLVISVDSDTQLTLEIADVALYPAAFTFPALLPTEIGWMDADFGVRVGLENALELYTISLDPNFGLLNRRLSFHAILTIEHSFTVLGTI
jgi:hypothetical protein